MKSLILALAVLSSQFAVAAEVKVHLPKAGRYLVTLRGPERECYHPPQMNIVLEKNQYGYGARTNKMLATINLIGEKIDEEGRLIMSADCPTNRAEAVGYFNTYGAIELTIQLSDPTPDADIFPASQVEEELSGQLDVIVQEVVYNDPIQTKN